MKTSSQNDGDLFVNRAIFDEIDHAGPAQEEVVSSIHDIVKWVDIFCNAPDSVLMFCNDKDECIDLLSDGESFFLGGCLESLGSYEVLTAPHNGKFYEISVATGEVDVAENGRLTKECMLRAVIGFCTNGSLDANLLWVPLSSTRNGKMA